MRGSRQPSREEKGDPGKVNDIAPVWVRIFNNIADVNIQDPEVGQFYSSGWRGATGYTLKHDLYAKYPQVCSFVHRNSTHQVTEGPAWELHDAPKARLFFASLGDVEDIISIGRPRKVANGYLNFFDDKQAQTHHPVLQAWIKKTKHESKKDSAHTHHYQIILRNQRPVRVLYIPILDVKNFDISDVKKLLNVHKTSRKLRIHDSSGTEGADVLELAYILFDGYVNYFKGRGINRVLDITETIKRLQQLRIERPGLIKTGYQFRMTLLLVQQLNFVKRFPHASAEKFTNMKAQWLKEMDQAAQAYAATLSESPELPELFTHEMRQKFAADYRQQEAWERVKNEKEKAEDKKGKHITFIQDKLDDLVHKYTDADTLGRWVAGKNRVKNWAGRFFGHETMTETAMISGWTGLAVRDIKTVTFNKTDIQTVGASSLRDQIDTIIYGQLGSNKEKFQEILAILFKRIVIFIESHTSQGAATLENIERLTILKNNDKQKDHIVVREIAKLLAEVRAEVSPDDPDWLRAQTRAMQCFTKYNGQACLDFISHAISLFPAAASVSPVVLEQQAQSEERRSRSFGLGRRDTLN